MKTYTVVYFSDEEEVDDSVVVVEEENEEEEGEAEDGEIVFSAFLIPIFVVWFVFWSVNSHYCADCFSSVIYSQVTGMGCIYAYTMRSGLF